jgi:hypothetical protein
VTTSGPARFERVTFLDAAMDDLKLVADRSHAVLTEVFRLLKRLDAGTLSPQPLHDFAKTGDLSDCGKIVVALPDEPEYRIVVKGQDGTFTVSEVIAVEDRSQDLPYLLAGLRLGRIDDAVRRSDAGRRVYRIRKMLEQQ